MKRRIVKESVSSYTIMNAIYDHFRSSYASDDFYGVVEDIIGRIDDYNSEDDIFGAIDDALIYDDDQWTVMKHYQRPDEANFSDAIEYLTEDIFAIASTLAEEDADEDLDEKFNRHPRKLKESRRKLREGGRRTYDLWDAVYADLTANGDAKDGNYIAGHYDENKVTTDFDGNIVVWANSPADFNVALDVANVRGLKTSGVIKSKSRYAFAPYSLTIYIPQNQVIGTGANGKPIHSNNLKLPNNKPLPRYKGKSLKGTQFGVN